MNTYVYQAALLCEPCGDRTRDRLNPSGEVNATWQADSDTFPQGPYTDGGGQADCPQHCDICGTFLENPLTPYGYVYVSQARDSKVSEMWREFYQVDRNEVAA